MVENEVKRQVNLIEIKNELQKRDAKVLDEIYNLNDIFEKTNSKIISKAISKDGNVFAIKLEGFKGSDRKRNSAWKTFWNRTCCLCEKNGSIRNIPHR